MKFSATSNATKIAQNDACVAENVAKKKRAQLKINQLGSFSVGITGLEPATSRPPDVCATNCAKSRSFYNDFSEIGCKGTALFR